MIKLLEKTCSALDEFTYWIQWRFIIGKEAREAYQEGQKSRFNFGRLVACRNILRRRLEFLKATIGENSMAFQLLATPYRQLDRWVNEFKSPEEK